MSREAHLDIGSRRFAAGERYEVAGFRFRIEAGRKALTQEHG
jgi:hypothetical protein